MPLFFKRMLLEEHYIKVALMQGVTAFTIVFIAAFIASDIIYTRAIAVLEKEIKQNLIYTANIVANTMNGDLHKLITSPSQQFSPEYKQALAPLEAVIRTDPRITFAFTAIEHEGRTHFVLDATPLGDANRDGIQDKSYVMETYDDAPIELIEAIQTRRTTSSVKPRTDRWGTFMSGFAPFYDSQKQFVGAVGISMRIGEYTELLSPVKHAIHSALVASGIISSLIGILISWIAIISYRYRLTQQKLMKDLANAKDRAEYLDHAKTEFLANMSHELRTPMHAILSFSNFGLKDVSKLSHEKEHPLLEQLYDHFSSIRDSGVRLLKLINDLLDLSKLEAGKMQLNGAEQSIFPIIETVTNELKPLFLTKNITLHQIYNPSENYTLWCDSEKLIHVIRNLFSNAIKFNPEGEKIILSLQKDHHHTMGEALYLTIRDHGMGIPDTELESIFDKFFQSSKTKTGAGGTGLGLAICREMITLHNGLIWASNHPEGGAIFHLLLPMLSPLEG